MKSTTMAQPTNFWNEFIEFAKDFSVPTGLFVLIWKTIDKVGAHFAQRRKDAIKELIKDEVNPQIERLTKSIENLNEAIHDLRIERK